MKRKSRIIPIIVGVFSIIAIASSFTTFHITTLHIDCADKSSAIADNSKVPKVIPVLLAIIAHVSHWAVPVPVFTAYVPERSPVSFLLNCRISPRAPPFLVAYNQISTQENHHNAHNLTD